MRIALTKLDHQRVVKVGAILLLALHALLSNFSYLRARLSEGPQTHQQDVPISDERFAPVRAALPEHGTVGYIDENVQEGDIQVPSDLSKLGWWTKPGVKKYYLAQFSLAPVILVRGTEPPLVIGNFDNTQVNAGTPPRELLPVRDFGSGIILFEKKTK